MTKKEKAKLAKKLLLPPKWQDTSRTWTTVDEVYETRWDCSTGPAAGW